jgi:hypothetical protein
METQIIFFAGLKDYYSKYMKMNVDTQETYHHILKRLCELKPEATDLLNSSRFACNGEFVELTDTIGPGSEKGIEICVMPPASGG